MKALRRASVLVGLIVATALGATSAAVAQSDPSVAPPGNSAVDQYRESLPPSPGDRRSLSRDDRTQLRRRGSDGQALADVLERSGGVPRAADADGRAPSSSSSGSKAAEQRRSRDDRSSGAAHRPTADGDAAGTGTADDGRRAVAPAAAASTVGPVPVWAMLVAAVVLVGVGLVVRRRATS